MIIRSRALEVEAMVHSAASRIPRQHLALVLAELLISAHRVWTFHAPDDGCFAWAVARLRAWAVGAGSWRALKRVAAEAAGEDSPFVVDRWDEFDDEAQADAGTALVRALQAVVVGPPAEHAVAVVDAVASACANRAEAAAEREAEAWTDALIEVERGLEPDDAPPEWFEVAEAEERAFDRAASARRKALLASLEESAAIVRALVPPQSPTQQWKVRGELIISGEVVLRLDGWRLVDASRIDELVTLEGERSVAFDACLERAGVCKLG